MKIPVWVEKFISRKLAALAAVLITHYLISRGMELQKADALANAIAQGAFAIVDAFVAWKYLDEQGKNDREDKKYMAPEDKALQAVQDAIERAKKEKK